MGRVEETAAGLARERAAVVARAQATPRETEVEAEAMEAEVEAMKAEAEAEAMEGSRTADSHCSLRIRTFDPRPGRDLGTNRRSSSPAPTEVAAAVPKEVAAQVWVTAVASAVAVMVAEEAAGEAEATEEAASATKAVP